VALSSWNFSIRWRATPLAPLGLDLPTWTKPYYWHFYFLSLQRAYSKTSWAPLLCESTHLATFYSYSCVYLHLCPVSSASREFLRIQFFMSSLLKYIDKQLKSQFVLFFDKQLQFFFSCFFKLN
jgi:hypothetical protein